MTENDTAILEVLQAVQDFKDGELSEGNLINYLTDTEFEIPSREYPGLLDDRSRRRISRAGR